MSRTGVSGKPRRRSGGTSAGRTNVLAVLDQVVAEKKSQKALRTALRAKLMENPLRFFITMGMPLLPREAASSDDWDGVVKWQSLLGNHPAGSRQGEVRP